MKRKPKNQNANSSPQAAFILKKIDDAVEALSENEDQIAKVLGVLYEKDLTEKDREILNKGFDLYSKSTESLKKTIEK